MKKLAIQFIIGQLNAPLQQLSDFLRTAQDAQISLERLGEIHDMKEEDLAWQPRALGMKLTIFGLIALGIANLVVISLNIF